MLQGSPKNLLGFKGAVGGSLFTAISHGRIGDVVQTSHARERKPYTGGTCMLPLIVLTLQKTQQTDFLTILHLCA